MAKDRLVVGPVLSFRGLDEAEGLWKVTALIGVAPDAPIPVVEIDGKLCPSPVLLLATSQGQFFRYDLSCPVEVQQRRVEYKVVGESFGWSFTVPGNGYAPRIAYVSCNGFSDPSAMRKLVRPEGEVWADLLCNHDKRLRPADYVLDKEQLWHEDRTHDQGIQRFQLLVMGGDQIYFDSIWEDLKPLKRWVGLARKEQLRLKVSAALERDIERYYFNLYADRWLPASRKGWGRPQSSLDAACAMSSIPTVMMWDDHDIFDGWGSYSPEMQCSPLFQAMFRHARRAFWVFQLQHCLSDLPDLDFTERPDVSPKDPQYQPISWTERMAADPLALPFLNEQPGFTSAYHFGPLSLVAADLRTERSRTQVMGPKSWSALQKWLQSLKDGEPRHPGSKCQHLVFMSSVPVAHPKLSRIEGLLDTFGHEHVLDSNADDLKDHWSHDDHEGERKRLLETLTQIAEQRKLRVSIVSGDVHVAAWGSAYRRDIDPTANWAQIQQFTSSAIVHPSLMGLLERVFLGILNKAASEKQSIDVQHTVEMMLFPGYNRYVMPARNWLALELDLGEQVNGCKLWATWRCETETGFSNHLQAVHPAHSREWRS